MTALSEILHEVAIGLGSNLGDSRVLVQLAWQELCASPGCIPVAISAPYRSRPLVMVSDHYFINAVALIQTHLSPEQLLRHLQAIETQHGRTRSMDIQGYQDRTLDLDILLYGSCTIQSDYLIIPHPRLEERLFVLAPLAEIAADRLHPRWQKTIRALLADLRENDAHQGVEKISWEGFVPFYAQ